jgi:hypothetical protein
MNLKGAELSIRDRLGFANGRLLARAAAGPAKVGA